MPVESLIDRKEGVVILDGVEMYCIPDADRMPPFLMSIVSASELWMYISSRGGLTCGRRDEEGALFPYVTDDQLHIAHAHTGPLTVLRLHTPEGIRLWRPFDWSASDPKVQRALYKSTAGNELVFESIDNATGLCVRQRWSAADSLGFIRTVTIDHRGDAPVEIEILDGLRNLMPGGARRSAQSFASCLVNAYTRVDVDPQTKLAAVALSAQVTDGAVPIEVLEATTIWCTGLEPCSVLLSTDQIEAFSRGETLVEELLLTGRRGAYLVNGRVSLCAGQVSRWDVVADVGRSHVEVEKLRQMLLDRRDRSESLDRAIADETLALLRLVASADGMQFSNDRALSSHHYANVLFNIMRGGVFARNNEIDVNDLARNIQCRNRQLAERFSAELQKLGNGEPLDKARLLQWATAQGDPGLLRLAFEYLPLTFSRRHGDPSRPWNRFTIQVKHVDGSPALAYQGNWRDIFQNWEALLVSFPEFIESVIAKFVNASTADGFNPYRVTHEGIDWELPNPADPWANIGYWGDHQIVYLTRLMELSRRHNPGALAGMMRQCCFSYADVPYRIRPYEEIVADPRNTIHFDDEANRAAQKRARDIGSDGKLLHADGKVLHVTLAEKLLVPILAKLSNFVPDAGIWLNTQRPEWNDANNALVGIGISMVTVYQLRRHLALCTRLFEDAGESPFFISHSVRIWLAEVLEVLRDGRVILNAGRVSSSDARRLLDQLGNAFSRYRDALYRRGPGEPVRVDSDEIRSLLETALLHVDHAIAANRRPDGLYHSYNLLDLSQPGHARVGHLYEMLEGQVAALSSGLLSSEQSVEVIEALYRSAMYRADQQSFMLYPKRSRPTFFDKNIIPESAANAIGLLDSLLRAGDTRLVNRDVRSRLRFDHRITSLAKLSETLDELADDPRWRPLVARDRDAVIQTFSDVFEIRQFTGRSGTMFGYEGIGCIYWHMVAKLLLAVQECALRAIAEDSRALSTLRLIELYFRVRDGLGFRKDARTYGAFPADPYSHTPGHAGAQQPGMTGQVKEEILARWGELGITFDGRHVEFRPRLLRESEFTREPTAWRYLDLHGQWQTVNLPARSLAFTLQGQPVIYQLADVTSDKRHDAARFRARRVAQVPLLVPISRSDLVCA